LTGVIARVSISLALWLGVPVNFGLADTQNSVGVISFLY
jgi:hypothetical protein